MIRNVMQGKDEGVDNAGNDDEGNAERVSATGRKSHPVRPGMFLETVSKLMSKSCLLHFILWYEANWTTMISFMHFFIFLLSTVNLKCRGFHPCDHLIN
ncbi:hypothetical protein HN51_036284 [Arachis hypogaea]